MTRRSATERDTLSGPQAVAAAALATGATVSDAATAAGVHRATVSAWAHHDATFIAMTNQLRAEAFGQLADRLRVVVTAALETVAAAIGGGNVDAALAVLKLAGVDRLPLAPSGPTDASEARLDLVL
jgi:hypothetical protein